MRPTHPDHRSPVVVGIDGSDEAAAAARWAAAVAPAVRRTPAPDSRAAEGRCARRGGEDLRAAFGGLEVITLASDVPVDQMLTEQSRTAQMVVLGSEAVSAAAAMLVGSTTLAVSAHSACPVVVWRGSDSAPTARPVVLGVEDAATGLLPHSTPPSSSRAASGSA